MKIFITGATGFIGTHLLELLTQSNHELICLVRNRSRLDKLKKYGVQIKYGDVTDSNSIQSAMRGCDWAVHMAGVYSMWEPDNSVFKKVNIEGTKNFMESCIENKISKVVHISTASVYGKPSQSPFNERSKPNNRLYSEYAYSKREAEKIVWNLYNKKQLPVTILQPGVCLGKYDTKPSGQYIKQLISGRIPFAVFSKSLLTWTSAVDVSEAVLKSLYAPNAIGKKYIIGTEVLSLENFNKLICGTITTNPPKIKIPSYITLLLAYLMTKISNITKFPPLMGLSYDQAKTMYNGFQADGSAIEKELQLKYSPLLNHIKEAVFYLSNNN